MQSTTFRLSPIGLFETIEEDKYALPRQAGLGKKNQGKIILNPQQNFEQALEDLNGFDRIWVVFWFHQNGSWKPKVLTPHGPPKRGVFATRSPYRPNPIGLSCLEIIEIKGLEIHVADHDLLNGTPILDIKPYLTYADSWPEAKQGWLKESLKTHFTIRWSPLANTQMDYLEHECNIMMKENIILRISTNPYPHSNNRIQCLSENHFQLAYKTWRFHYEIQDNQILIHEIRSGYDQETLNGLKTSKWDDVPIHQIFFRKFSL